MNIKNKEIYPDCLSITRTVEVGGLTKSQLMQSLFVRFGRNRALLFNKDKVII